MTESSQIEPGRDRTRADGPGTAPAASERPGAPPDEAVRELAAFFAAEGYDPADLLLFCPDVPGREEVMTAMAGLRTQAS